MLMGVLIYTSSQIGENDGDSEGQILGMYTTTTLILSRHAELLVLGGIIVRRMEKWSQEDLSDLEMRTHEGK